MGKMANARKANQDLRGKLLAKNSVQLKNFFKALTERQLGRIKNAVENAGSEQSKRLLAAKKRAIAKLTKEVAKLEGK